jgi:hypothetical protein
MTLEFSLQKATPNNHINTALNIVPYSPRYLYESIPHIHNVAIRRVIQFIAGAAERPYCKMAVESREVMIQIMAYPLVHVSICPMRRGGQLLTHLSSGRPLRNTLGVENVLNT